MTPFPYRDFVRARENLERAAQTETDVYLLLTGGTGTGKSALLTDLRARADRCRQRFLYFSHAQRLGAIGLVRILARSLRLPIRRSHAETVQDLARHLAEEPQQIVLHLDQAHELPEETLSVTQALIESNPSAPPCLRVLLAGLPPLRERLQNSPALWRRIAVREELTGLTIDEMPAFLDHHFGDQASRRLAEDGVGILFERGRGTPGFILPMCRAVLRELPPDGPINPLQLEEILQRWDLP